jgi:hypothetical protein
LVDSSVKTSFNNLTSFAQEYLDSVFVKVLLIVHQFVVLLIHDLLDFDVSPSLKISIFQLFVVFIFNEFSVVVFDLLFDFVKPFEIALTMRNQELPLLLPIFLIWRMTIILKGGVQGVVINRTKLMVDFSYAFNVF